MPKQTAAEKLLARMCDPDRPTARGAVNDLTAANFATIDAVVRAIEAGAPANPYAAADIATRYRTHKRITALFPLDGYRFDDDARFTTARFAMFARPHLGSLAALTEQNLAIRGQMHRMLRAGRLTNVDLFTPLVYSLLHQAKPPRGFVVDVLAHRKLNYQILLSEAQQQNGYAGEFVKKNYGAVQQRREYLFQRVWLPGQLTKTEWAALRGVPLTLRRELYAAEHAAGYEGYVRHVAAQRVAGVSAA